jgi:hypothetical protein
MIKIKIKFLAEKFCIKIKFCQHYFSQLNSFMRKRKDQIRTSD